MGGMTKTIKTIAIYGKGGIGKSTTASNVSAALACSGYRVLQFGCDPKSDSTNLLRNGAFIPTILDTLNTQPSISPEEIVHRGFNGVYCIESGGPAPGVGCAGRGIITAVELVKRFGIFEELKIDVVIYDVLGDVVCGGFAMPIREGIADHVFVVSSSDFMSIYAANNLFKGIKKYSDAGGALLGGIIANFIDTPIARNIVDDFAEKTGTQVYEYLPRAAVVAQSELRGRTVIEQAPESAQANLYRRLAEKLMRHTISTVPVPIEQQHLRNWAASWAESLINSCGGTEAPDH
jgi:nitrogenase iron protein NifH